MFILLFQFQKMAIVLHYDNILSLLSFFGPILKHISKDSYVEAEETCVDSSGGDRTEGHCLLHSL